jgi:pimeloyl-ACP methyl ester carboxylesterase
MCVVDSRGVRIRYETIGKGRPLVLLHGWGVDRTSWTGAGYIDELESDYRLVNIDIRGHGASDKPHEPAAYTADVLVRDVFAVADAEGLDRFGIWGHSYGGWIAWLTAAADPGRVAAIVTSGAWDPRPKEPLETEDLVALRQGGTKALLDRMRIASGERFDGAFPPWIQDIALRGDSEALFASYSKMWADGLDDEALRSFPVPALLIAGELEDEGDAAAGIAAMIPSGQRLRLQGLGHVGTCNACALTVPTAREFLDRWVAR